MKQYRGQTVGCCVYDLRGVGHVTSVYEKAVNIHHPSGLLVALVEEDSRMTALSLTVPGLFDRESPNARPTRPGDPVIFKGHRIILDNSVIGLDGSRRWSGKLRTRDLTGFCPSRLPFIHRALLTQGKAGGLLGLIHPVTGDNLPVTGDDLFLQNARETMGSIRLRSQRTGLLSGLGRLVGLGIGVTPSGDDLVTGFLLGERLARHASIRSSETDCMDSQRATFPIIEKEDIRNARGRTTMAGWTLLFQALQGRFPAYLIEAVNGLYRGTDPEDDYAVVKRAARHGATSGTDALVGLYLYMDIQTNGEKDPHPKRRLL